jgi:hypothetical protein
MAESGHVVRPPGQGNQLRCLAASARPLGRALPGAGCAMMVESHLVRNVTGQLPARTAVAAHGEAGVNEHVSC